MLLTSSEWPEMASRCLSSSYGTWLQLLCVNARQLSRHPQLIVLTSGHPELKAMRVNALDWERHDHNIYDKFVDWFSLIEKELADPQILPENIYNMDEIGVLLSVLNYLRSS